MPFIESETLIGKEINITTFFGEEDTLLTQSFSATIKEFTPSPLTGFISAMSTPGGIIGLVVFVIIIIAILFFIIFKRRKKK